MLRLTLVVPRQYSYLVFGFFRSDNVSIVGVHTSVLAKTTLTRRMCVIPSGKSVTWRGLT